MLAGEIGPLFALIAQIDGSGKRGKSCRHVNYGATSKVKYAKSEETLLDLKVMCANGAYIKSENNEERMYDLNFTRSANVPVIKAGVMMANFNWKNAKKLMGWLATNPRLPSSTFWNIKNERGSPMNPPIVSPKARLKPTTIQRTLITPMAIKLCNMVLMMFWYRSSTIELGCGVINNTRQWLPASRRHRLSWWFHLCSWHSWHEQR